jgi:hypothetical protein
LAKIPGFDVGQSPRRSANDLDQSPLRLVG